MILYTFNDAINQQIMNGEFQVINVKYDKKENSMTILTFNENTRMKAKFRIDNVEIDNLDQKENFEFFKSKLSDVGVSEVKSAYGKQVFIADYMTIINENMDDEIIMHKKRT